jgi:predicted TPR repeat methyltransferase
MNASHDSEPSEATRLCTTGYEFLEQRRFAEAHALLKRALALAPLDSRVHYNLGLLYSDLGRTAEALAAFDACLRLDPGNAKAHNNRGSALQILKRLPEAGDAFQRAIDLRPDLELPYVNLGKLREAQGRVQEAIAIYDLAIARGQDRELFGQDRAAALGQSTQRSPDSWVSSTFDNFAPRFDAHLASLHYHVPQALAALLMPHADRPLSILDLGCGTGLVGAALAGHGHRLVGVDLSEKMLSQARARGIYAQLDFAEIHAWLQRAETESFDAICAADVLIYIGALETLFRECARLLRPGGWFAFSTEECSDTDYKLLVTGRYAQSQDYVRRLAGESFVTVDAEPTTIRIESGAPLAGRLYLLQRK